MAPPALSTLAPMPLRQGLPWALLGMAGLGLGIALTVRAELGLGPWDVLHQGIAERTGLGIGVAGILVGVVVLAVALPLGAQVGVATLINVVFVGVVVDGSLALLPAVEHLALRGPMLLAGVACGGLGTALYLITRLGTGPRDGLMTALSDPRPRRRRPTDRRPTDRCPADPLPADRPGRSLRLVRTAIELTVLALGLLLGGSVGVGTVLWALLVGPVVQQGLLWCRPLVRRR